VHCLTRLTRSLSLFLSLSLSLDDMVLVGWAAVLRYFLSLSFSRRHGFGWVVHCLTRLTRSLSLFLLLSLFPSLSLSLDDMVSVGYAVRRNLVGYAVRRNFLLVEGTHAKKLPGPHGLTMEAKPFKKTWVLAIWLVLTVQRGHYCKNISWGLCLHLV